MDVRLYRKLPIFFSVFLCITIFPVNLKKSVLQGAWLSNSRTATEAYLSVPSLKKQVDDTWDEYKNSCGIQKSDYDEMISTILEREKQFNNQYYVFYHGQKSDFILLHDLLEEIYLRINPNEDVQDFVFVRFWDSFPETVDAKDFIDHEESGFPGKAWHDSQPHLSKGMLPVNLSFYGNLGNSWESSFHYFLKNRNVCFNGLSSILNNIFTNLNLNSSFVEDLIHLNILDNNHSSSVNSAQFSHDDHFIVTASYDHTAKIWDVKTGNCIRTLTGHTGSVNSAQFSHDDRFIVTASSDKTAKIWDVKTGSCICTLIGHIGWVLSAQFSHDDRHIVTASGDNTAKIWDVKTGSCVRTLTGHTDWVYSAQFSHDDRFIVTASDDKTAKIWDAKTGNVVKTLGKKQQQGTLLQIFIPKTEVDKCVFITHPGGTPYRHSLIHDIFDSTKMRHSVIKPILEKYRISPSMLDEIDSLQGRIILSKDIMLKPGKVKIFRYTTIPEEEMNNYRKKLSSIVAEMFEKKS